MAMTLDEYENGFGQSDDAAINAFFKTTKASDYYFQVDEVDGDTFVVIVAKPFFDENECVDDQTEVMGSNPIRTARLR